MAIPLLILNVRFAPRLGLIDWPKTRGMSDTQIPIIGHSIAFIVLSVLFVITQLYDLAPWFAITAVFMGAMGHFDDKRPLPPLDKLFYQIGCVTTVTLLDPKINEALISQFGAWGVLWGIFFILGLINAINFIDGIDGLAGIVMILGACGFLLFSYDRSELFPYFLLASVIIGVFLPFLYFNAILQTGFLGNTGSYLFSYLLAVMLLSLPMPTYDLISRLSIFSLCFLVPIADTIMVISTRLFSRRSPFKPDKGHLHHRLVQSSLPLRYILLNLVYIESAGLAVAYHLYVNPAAARSPLPLVICLTLVITTALLILMIERASRRRLESYLRRLDSGQPIYFLKYEMRNADGSQIDLRTLQRVEDRISAEIRITDLCFAVPPCTLFVSLKTLAEPLRGISARLDTIFQSEKIERILVVDQGEFIKVSYHSSTPMRAHSK